MWIPQQSGSATLYSGDSLFLPRFPGRLTPLIFRSVPVGRLAPSVCSDRHVLPWAHLLRGEAGFALNRVDSHSYPSSKDSCSYAPPYVRNSSGHCATGLLCWLFSLEPFLLPTQTPDVVLHHSSSPESSISNIVDEIQRATIVETDNVPIIPTITPTPNSVIDSPPLLPNTYRPAASE